MALLTPNEDLIQKWRQEGLQEAQIEERLFDLHEVQRDREELEFLKGYTTLARQKEKNLRRNDQAQDDPNEQSELFADSELVASVEEKSPSAHTPVPPGAQDSPDGKKEKKHAKEKKKKDNESKEERRSKRKEEKRRRKEERRKRKEGKKRKDRPLVEEVSADSDSEPRPKRRLRQTEESSPHSPPLQDHDLVKAEMVEYTDLASDVEEGGTDPAKMESRRHALKDEEEHLGSLLDPEPETPVVDMSPATRENLCKIQITRRLAEKWLTEPFWKDLVLGCPVRMFLGSGVGGKPCYMICEVLSVKTLAQRKYKVGAVCTQDVLEVAFDADPKDLRIDALSNGAITDGEYKHWMEGLTKNGRQPITKDAYQKKLASMQQLSSFRYTDDQITEMVNRRRKLQPDEFMNLPQERSHLRGRLDILTFQGKQGTAEYLELERKMKKLLEVELRRLDRKSDPWMPAILHTARNRAANMLTQYRRILDPKGAAKAEDRTEEEQDERGHDVDVYARIPTRPSIYWYTGGSGGPTDGRQQERKDREDRAHERAGQRRLQDVKTVDQLLLDAHGTPLLSDNEVAQLLATPLRPRAQHITPAAVAAHPAPGHPADSSSVSLKDYTRLKVG